jgi:hypothetical protein
MSEKLGFYSQQRQEISLFSIASRPALGPTSLLSNVYMGLFPREISGRGVKLTTHLHLVPRLRMVELYLHSPIRLYGMVLR